MARSLKNISLSGFATMLLIVVIACFGRMATLTFSDKSGIDFADSEIATLSEEDFRGGSLEKGRTFYHNSEILMPNEIAVPVLERNNSNSSNSGLDQTCGRNVSYLQATMVYAGIRLKESFIQENRQKSHLKLIGYYIYQLCKIII